MARGIYAAVFFKTGQFEWTNGTVIVISALCFSYAAISILAQKKKWVTYRYIADAAMVLALVYISIGACQITLMMIAVIPWWIIHRWVGAFVFNKS